MSLWRVAEMIISSFQKVTMQLATSRQQQASPPIQSRNAEFLIPLPDDVKDIYRRAEQEELVVEGLREGDTLVGQE